MPYTYCIKCLPTNQYYYGVRFTKTSTPDDLWKTYFTSSKHIKTLVREYGKDAFIYEIRRVFDDPAKAREWEHKVLRRLKVRSREDFINQTDNKAFNSSGMKWWTNGVKNTRAVECPGEGWRYGTNKLGTKRSKESVKKQMETRLKKYGSYATNKGKEHKPETKQKISASKLGQKYGPQTIEHIERRKLVGIRNPMYKPDLHTGK